MMRKKFNEENRPNSDVKLEKQIYQVLLDQIESSYAKANI